MKIFTRSFVFLLMAFGTSGKVNAATDSLITQRVRAAVVLPLYLDSMFRGGVNYKYGNGIPKFALPALEFYNGVQFAADSLQKEGRDIRIEIVDSRKKGAVQQLYSENNYNKPNMVIGVVQSGSELKEVAGLSLNNNIPFISATYPNDGGVNNNASLLIINSTLRTHCDALYKYIQQNYSGSNVLLFARKGGADERIKSYLVDAHNKADEKIKWKLVSLTDTFTKVQLGVYLDSNAHTAAIAASLDDDFSLRLIKTFSALKGKYRASVFGMPTWDEYNLFKTEFKGVEVVYSTPFISYSANPALYSSLTQKFKKLANSKPSDMFYKGFEITYRYLKAYSVNPSNKGFFEHLNDAGNRLFADFSFAAVPAKNDGEQTEYWENKKIYFIKKMDGMVKSVE